MASRSTLLIAPALLGISLLLSTPALACKCMFPPVETAREDATAVFEGRVLTIEASPTANDVNGELQVTLDIVRTWKGLEKEEHVSVFTNGQSASCGYTFAKDTSYLIYARIADDKKLHVSSCSRTKPLADSAEDLAFLGAGNTPVHVEPKAITDTTIQADASLPAPTPVQATPTAAPAKKKGCSIAQGDAGSDAWLLSIPALALLLRRRRRSV